MAPRIFFSLIFIYFLKYETIETYARAFLSLTILAVGNVSQSSQFFQTESLRAKLLPNSSRDKDIIKQ